MTAVDVAVRGAAIVPGVPECMAMIPLLFDPDGLPELMRCPEPPVTQVEGRCTCGHVRGGWLCETHEQLLGESGCRACLEDEDDPHDCLLTVTRVTEAGRG